MQTNQSDVPLSSVLITAVLKTTVPSIKSMWVLTKLTPQKSSAQTVNRSSCVQTETANNKNFVI